MRHWPRLLETELGGCCCCRSTKVRAPHGPVPQDVELAGDGTLKATMETADSFVLVAGGRRNAAAVPALRAAGVPILHVYNQSTSLWFAHSVSGEKLDCVHWCSPSATELWMWPLAQALAQLPRLRATDGV